MVYRLAEKIKGSYAYGYTEVDGDPDKIVPVDFVDDGGKKPMIGYVFQMGLPVRHDYVPTKIMRDEPKRRQLPDFTFAWKIPVVSEAIKAIVERFEPGVHQFLPVDVLWKDGSLAAKRYFLFTCNRLDTVHRGLTTVKFGGIIWEPSSRGDDRLVFDTAKFAGKHLWFDKHVLSSPLVSKQLADALRAAGITGLDFVEDEEA